MQADLADRTDFENAERGLIARLEPGVVRNAGDQVVWDIDAFGRATQGECPPTVNRSLWRQSQLTAV
jgi:alkyl sulfatase BDS1-like metallo-beta-lactamase superfamily hydrolase